jgi:hypothetical protein
MPTGAADRLYRGRAQSIAVIVLLHYFTKILMAVFFGNIMKCFFLQMDIF